MAQTISVELSMVISRARRKRTCMTQPMMKTTKPRLTAVFEVLIQTDTRSAKLDMASWNSKKVRKGSAKLFS